MNRLVGLTIPRTSRDRFIVRVDEKHRKASNADADPHYEPRPPE